MHLAKTLTVLSAALLWFTATAHAHHGAISPAATSPAPRDHSTPSCKIANRYDGHLQRFTNITGSFFHKTWYLGTEITNTTGTDNVPGATRAGLFAGQPFIETLTKFDAPPGALRFTFFGSGPGGAPFTYTPPGETQSVRFDYLAETHRYESICGGKATYIDVLAYLCSNRPREVYDLWNRGHQTTFDALSAKVGAKIFTGDCP